MDTHQDMSSHAETPVRSEPKKPYVSPVLEQYGDLRDLTMGGSPGRSDSGSANTKKKR